jgi:hypothetical protein
VGLPRPNVAATRFERRELLLDASLADYGEVVWCDDCSPTAVLNHRSLHPCRTMADRGHSHWACVASLMRLKAMSNGSMHIPVYTARHASGTKAGDRPIACSRGRTLTLLDRLMRLGEIPPDHARERGAGLFTMRRRNRVLVKFCALPDHYRTIASGTFCHSPERACVRRTGL